MAASQLPLRLPGRVYSKLCELCVPLSDSGAVWMPTKMRRAEPEMYDFIASRLVDGKKRGTDAFFGQGRPRYVAPVELGYELPKRGSPEIAFAGRSNVGKSSLLGALMESPGLCRRSKRPGCTATVNFFELRGLKQSYLVDLPGFGYAQRGKDEQQSFSDATVGYLAQRDRMILRHIVLLVDARRGLQADRDREAIQALYDLRISHHIVLTKADLIKPPDLAVAIAAVFRELNRLKILSTCHPLVHVCSAKTGFGVPELRDYIASFLE